MGYFLKLLGVLSIFSLYFTGIYTNASTGTIYTGTLINYVQMEKVAINSGFDTVYNSIYTTFTKTGLNIVKSVEYQGLVCLGAIKDQSLLVQLQKDKTALKVSLNRDFVELEKKALGLEEKNIMQQETAMMLFDVGTTYESEKDKLKDEVATKVQLHRGLITGFATSYLSKIGELISTFGQYRDANKSLIQGVVNKMEKVQQVVSAFTEIEKVVNKINDKIAGSDDLMQKLEVSKAKGLENLNKNIQSLNDTNIKKYKRLQNLDDGLTPQRLSVIEQYQTDFDDFLTQKFKYRYDRSKYITLKKELESFKRTYYIAANQLNCSSVLSVGPDGASLLTKIATMKAEIDSGWVRIENEGIPTTLKDQIYNGFQAMYVQKFKQRYAEYQDHLKNYIKLALKNLIAAPPPVGSTGTAGATTGDNGVVGSTLQEMPKYIFTQAFKSGQYSEEIKILQNVLVNLGLYSGAIDGTYNKATKNAVYQFQLSKGLLKGYEKKPDVRGRFGPGTRAAINKIIK